MLAPAKLTVHDPLQGEIVNARRVLMLCWPLVRPTSAVVVGKEVPGKSSLITKALGRMTVERGARFGSAKPDTRVERTETAAMRVNFMVDSR